MRRLLTGLVAAVALMATTIGAAAADGDGPELFHIERDEIPSTAPAVYWEARDMWCTPGANVGVTTAIYVCAPIERGSFGPLDNYPTPGAALN